MKLTLLTLIFFISACGDLFSQTDEQFLRLNSLNQKKQFFKLRDELKSESLSLDKIQNEYFNALMYCAFNKPAESNLTIDKLLNEDSEKLSDSMRVELLECKITNSVNLFQYTEAMKATDLLLSKYKSLIEADDIEDFENTSLILKSGNDVAPQTVTVNGDTKLGVKKDLAGLMNIPVNINNLEEDFIFDTGANFSTVSSSFAKKIGLKQLEGSIEVGTATDKKVVSGIAYADSLRIGNLTFTNVVFLVLPDEALSFAGGVYVIHGIIGFPVIKEMKEISISENEIFIPSVSKKSSYENLSLDGFLPIIQTLVNSDTLIFAFDTGAKKTIMYFPYFEKYRDLIESKYEPQDIKFGGAGGDMVIKGFKLGDLNFQIASGKAELDDVSLLSKHIKENDQFLYGNLGGDFINKFRRMIINFENMYVEFQD